MNQTSALPQLIHTLYTLVKSAKGHDASGSLVIEEQNTPLMMKWEILCSEGWARRDITEVGRLSKGTLFEEWALHEAEKQAAICNVLPRGIVEPEDGERIHSSVPVLLMTGEADPQDPPDNVAHAERELPNSLTLIVPGAAHTVGHLGCLPSVVIDFVKRGSTSGL